MENKATLSYSFSKSGDENLFLTLSTKLVETVFNHVVEWRHTYGRLSHQLHLNVKILPLLPALLERKDLVTRPYCHIFFTDCSDVDQYRSTIRGEIADWLSLLSTHNNMEWIIVVLTGDVLSRLTKAKLQLPRMSITDKVKTDFCSKNPERLHVLHEPNRESAKSSESWTALGAKVANMTVRCMEAVVAKYEDQVRFERERRNEKSWDFCTYFLLQEDLAFMYEMLEMYGSALVQYDELDAMFTQYVLNANAGDIAHWLTEFSQPITRWHSLLLWNQVDSEARQMISSNRASLIDIRNYLFNRLCHLLFQMGKVTEVTQRMHFFLHSIATEIDILEIEIPAGAVECWVFMCCLELVDALKRKSGDKTSDFNQPDVVPPSDMSREKLVLENASLWNLARLKLFSLGKICGLMPGDKTTSSHLQMVVDLLAGMGEGEERGDITIPPSLILREAISSKSNFQRQYFELSELAMGTFKHMGHFRAARSIGSDLAKFYLLLGEPAQAEGYLVDSARMFARDGWKVLFSKANQVLAKCYKQMLNIRKYLRLCYALMCDDVLSVTERSFYCDEYCAMSTDLGDRLLCMNAWPLATISSIRFEPVQTSFRIHCKQYVEIFVTLHAPKPMNFQQLSISLEHSSTSNRYLVPNEGKSPGVNSPSSKKSHASVNKNQTQGSHGRHRHQSSTSSKDVMMEEHAVMDSKGCINLLNLNYNEFRVGQRPPLFPPCLTLHDQREVKDGDTLWAGITCRHAHDLLRRQESNPSMRNKYSTVTSVAMETYGHCLIASNVVLRPGRNTIKVEIDTEKEGFYQMQQLRLTLHKTYFVLPRILPIVTYSVTKRKPTIEIKRDTGLICGKVERISLALSLGDYQISEEDSNWNLTFDLPSNMHLLKVLACSVATPNDDDGSTEVACDVPLIQSHNKTVMPLPPSRPHSVVTMQLACICLIEQTLHQLEYKKRHRRTHSAPPATFSRSPKSTPRHRVIQETRSVEQDHSNDQAKFETNATNGEKENNLDSLKTSNFVTSNRNPKPDKLVDFKNSLKETLKFDVSPLKLFRSKSSAEVISKNLKIDFAKSWGEYPDESANSDNDAPSVRINGDLIEVTLDDDDTVNETTNVVLPPRKTIDETTTREKIPKHPKILQYTEEDIRPVVNQSISHARHSPSKSDADLRGFLPKPKITIESEQVSSHCELTILPPWDDVSAVTLPLSLIRPLEFTHAWNYSGRKERYLSVTVNNVTSEELTLRHPKIRFTDVSSAEVTYMGKQGKRSEVLLKPKGSCVFVWRVEMPDYAPSQLSAQHDVCIAVSDYDDEVNELFSTATYKFQLDNIQPIYSVKWWPSSRDGELRSGFMSTLHIEVDRLRVDPGIEPTSNGSHLLMFQVVDNRGRWAVCGKSTGVLTLEGKCISNNGELDNNITNKATAALEVMPLASGHLHLPHILLNRFIKRRSSEFDEQLSSTDSPVLKPPLLKSFDRGEVLYQEQGRQFMVLSSEDSDTEHSVTKL